MPKEEWGTKRLCPQCNTRFYDLMNDPMTCPACGAEFTLESLTSGRYTFTLESIAPRSGPNFTEEVARFKIRSGERQMKPVESMKRMYTARAMPTTEAGIRSDGFSQAYVSLGEREPDGSIAVRAFDKPLILLIWIGSLIMAFGGALSLTDRRFRVAAPRRAAASPAMPQPAE